MGTVVVRGSVAPWRPGQRVNVVFYRGGKRVKQSRIKVKKSKGNYGTFASVIITRKGGHYGVQARYRGKSGRNPVRRSNTKRKSWKVGYRSLKRGQCGKTVGGFRKALNRMALVPGKGSCFNGKVERAVLAYRKMNDLTRNTIASKRIVRNVFNGIGRYRVRKPGLGDHLEAPLSQQVLVFAKGKKPYAIFPTSTGKASTPTILGTYSFYRKDPGYNAIGMYYSSYFIRGYAIHGYASVPNYPASHGCLRTFIADQPRIYDMTSIGQKIYVYGQGRTLGNPAGVTPRPSDGPDLGPSGGLDPAAGARVPRS